MCKHVYVYEYRISAASPLHLILYSPLQGPSGVAGDRGFAGPRGLRVRQLCNDGQYGGHKVMYFPASRVLMVHLVNLDQLVHKGLGYGFSFE